MPRILRLPLPYNPNLGGFEAGFARGFDPLSDFSQIKQLQQRDKGLELAEQREVRLDQQFKQDSALMDLQIQQAQQELDARRRQGETLQMIREMRSAAESATAAPERQGSLTKQNEVESIIGILEEQRPGSTLEGMPHLGGMSVQDVLYSDVRREEKEEIVTAIGKRISALEERGVLPPSTDPEAPSRGDLLRQQLDAWHAGVEGVGPPSLPALDKMEEDYDLAVGREAAWAAALPRLQAKAEAMAEWEILDLKTLSEVHGLLDGAASPASKTREKYPTPEDLWRAIQDTVGAGMVENAERQVRNDGGDGEPRYSADPTPVERSFHNKFLLEQESQETGIEANFPRRPLSAFSPERQEEILKEAAGLKGRTDQEALAWARETGVDPEEVANALEKPEFGSVLGIRPQQTPEEGKGVLYDKLVNLRKQRNKLEAQISRLQKQPRPGIRGAQRAADRAAAEAELFKIEQAMEVLEELMRSEKPEPLAPRSKDLDPRAPSERPNLEELEKSGVGGG